MKKSVLTMMKMLLITLEILTLSFAVCSNDRPYNRWSTTPI